MKHSAQSEGEFSRLPDQQLGYSPEEVLSFFNRLADDYQLILTNPSTGQQVSTSRTIREVSFRTEAGGYSPKEVDQALDRVEDRFSELERRLYIQDYGLAAWQEAVAELRQLLEGRLNRPAGQRFRRPSKRGVKGYRVQDVDAFCQLMSQHLSGEEKLHPDHLRALAFRSARRAASYEERQVDAFVDTCIEYLLDTL